MPNLSDIKDLLDQAVKWGIKIWIAILKEEARRQLMAELEEEAKKYEKYRQKREKEIREKYNRRRVDKS